MTDLSRQAVVIGAGQITIRDSDPSRAAGPLELMASALLSAAGDARLTTLERLTHCFVVHSLSLRHPEPARLLARHMGLREPRMVTAGMGGHMPQWLVNRAAEMVATGERPVVAVVGAEALATRRLAKRAGIALDWPEEPGIPRTWPPMDSDFGLHTLEVASGLTSAVAAYALVESALAHESGNGTADHMASVAALMARFSAVAGNNPYSWFPVARTANDLACVSEDNRMVCHPYPKLLSAIMDVDMAAAVIVTDALTARELGLEPEHVAWLTGFSDAQETRYLSERTNLTRAPGLVDGSRVAFSRAGMQPEECDAFDLYSCFPSSVQVAMESIGIDYSDPRPLTLTGGLAAHGGPGSNYVTHAIANTLSALREGRHSHVLVHGNGYYLTKHSLGIYSSSQPPAVSLARPGTREADMSSSEYPTVPLLPVGEPTHATLIACCTPFGRDGAPDPAICLLEASGRRYLARGDSGLTQLSCSEDLIGQAVYVEPGDPVSAAHLEA